MNVTTRGGCVRNTPREPYRATHGVAVRRHRVRANMERVNMESRLEQVLQRRVCRHTANAMGDAS